MRVYLKFICIIFAFSIFFFAEPAGAATVTSTQSGNWSATSTWVGGVVPGAGDAAVIASGHTVTVDTNTTVGSNTSGVGSAITVLASSSSVYGTLAVSGGISLTLRGFDRTTNYALNVNRYARFEPASSSTIIVDLASDYQSYLRIDGHINANGVTFTIPSSNFNWNNTTTNQVLSGYTQSMWQGPTSVSGTCASGCVYVLKLVNTTSVKDPGPISNVSGTGIGSMGDSSFTVVSQTGAVMTNEVASLNAIANNGDYYIDYAKAVAWYKTTSTAITLTYNFKYGTWYSSGIVATANTDNSSLTITSSTLNYFGSPSSTNQSASETLYGAIVTRNKKSPSLIGERGLTIQGNIFNYCTKCIQIYDSTADSGNHIVVSSNTFNNARWVSTNWADGVISFGTLGSAVSYVDFQNNIFNSVPQPFMSLGRGTISNITFTGNTGTAMTSHLIPTGSIGSLVQNNTLRGFGGGGPMPGGTNSMDIAMFAEPGASGAINQFLNNTMSQCHRAARIADYMTLSGNVISQCYHHGFVFASSDGFYGNSITVTSNTIYSSFNPQDELQGGWTLGYNRTQWIDNVTVTHNTFNGSSRCIAFNDFEGTVVLGTRLTITDNICSNSAQGIYAPTYSSTNRSAVAATRIDYNNDYNNTTTPTNVRQGTFMIGGINYNTSSTRNVAGVYLYAPSSGYSLPDATNRSLVLAASGTEGSNKSLLLSWGGGTAQEIILAQGTATGGSATTLVDTGKSWTNNIFSTGTAGCPCQVIIVSGTGAGQVAMIKSNTSSTLTILAPTSNASWATAPDATSKYVIVLSQITLTDSGGTNNIQAGIYSPSLPLSNATYTDVNITITTNAFNADPQYVNAATGNFTPQNSALDNVGSDGGDIGAFTFSAADVTPPSTPGTPSFSSVSTSSLTLAWATSTDNVGVAFYAIYRGPASTSLSQIATTSVANYSNTGLTASTTYYYGVTARDAAGNVSATSTVNATTTHSIPDTTAPTITAFVMPTSSVSTTVAVSTFTATDGTAVTGYLITESTTTPSSTNPSWSGSAPGSFTFSASGTVIAYAWAKDAAGNISTSTSATISIANTASASTTSSPSAGISVVVGGGSAITPSTAPALPTTPVLSTVPASPSSSVPSIAIGAMSFATRSFSLGARGVDVIFIQTILSINSDWFSKDDVTGYFGPITREAVRRFQVAQGVADPTDAGYGIVGPRTKIALLKYLLNFLIMLTKQM